MRKMSPDNRRRGRVPVTVAGVLVWVTILLQISFITPRAQDTGSGLDFLNVGPTPRMLSLSGISSSASTGASALYSNPSLLAFEEKSSLDVSYTLWVADVKNQFAALNLRRSSRAFAFGVYSSGSDGFEARDRPGPSAGDFSVRYLSLAGAIAQRIGPVSLGVTTQFLREEVFQFRATGYAVSGGASVRFLNENVTAGMTLQNLGDMESLDEVSTPLPSTLNAGISAHLIRFTLPGESTLPVQVRLHGNWSKPVGDSTISNEAVTSIALSADLSNLIILEGGGRFGPTERPFSLGFALNLESIRINYALVPFETGFGTAHSFGLQYYFR
jgi:hypothetical protein